MIALFESVGWNTVAAIGLAIAVLIVGRVWKRPELIHVLWVVVLVKLVTPGFITVDAIPVPAAPAAAVSAPLTLPDDVIADASGTPLDAPTIPWMSIALAAWLGGSVLFLGTAIVRVRRFLRALQGAVLPDPKLLRAIDTLARRMDVRPRPRVRVVDAAVSPMVWGGLGGATLILPMKLMCELETAERETLLAHELAHLKRGDCWIRWIELGVTAALWWNPVVWWVRRNLRLAEEQACDRWVLELLPRAKRAYADGIVKTVEFLAGHGRTPALATGATGTRHIQERLTMILAPSRPGRLRRPILPALVLALLALPVIPGFAEHGDSRDDDQGKARAKAEILELEQEALELERRLYEIQRKREEVEGQLEIGRFKREATEMKRQVDELRAQGMLDEANELEADLNRTQERLSEELEWNRERSTEERALREAELQWRKSMIEREHAGRDQDEAAREAFEKAARQYERQVRDRDRAMREAEIAYEKAHRLESARQIEQKLKALAIKREKLSLQGNEAEAEEILEHMRRVKAELAEQQGHKEKQAQHLATARAEILERMELVGAEMGHADGDRLRDLETQLEDLSRRLEDIETELERVGAAR